MLQGYGTPTIGLTIFDSPRRRPLRRRLLAIGMVLAVALAGGLIGGLSHARDAAHPIPPGAFGYFPT